MLLRALPFLLFTTAAGAVPTSITYAGFLTENGAPVDGTVELVVELFNDPTGGTAVFLESFSGLVVPDGDLVVELGLQELLDDSVLSEPQLFVQVTVDGAVLLPRARLSSVPYALRAEDAASISGLTAADINTSVTDLQAQITALQTQQTALQTQLTTLQGQLTALASAGGPSVAFANVTGLAFSGGLSFAGGQATIATNGVTTTQIAADTIAAADIATGAVGTAEVADNTLTATDLAANSVGASELADGSVDANAINGSLARVYFVNIACGPFGVLSAGTSCNSLMCGVVSGNPRFLQCDSTTTCTATSAQLCNNSTLEYGWVFSEGFN